jgi:hypothetical protein
VKVLVASAARAYRDGVVAALRATGRFEAVAVAPDDALTPQLPDVVAYDVGTADDLAAVRRLVAGHDGGRRTLLFPGPPGAAKTRATVALAEELGLILHRIDLSRVVSKYIGETEKHLGRIIAAAEASDVILFSDEADALFGERSGVKDAHDRYANLQTAFLLQRLEAYEGLAILATNRAGDPGPVARRGFRFAIEFPPAEIEGRSEIRRARP